MQTQKLQRVVADNGECASLFGCWLDWWGCPNTELGLAPLFLRSDSPEKECQEEKKRDCNESLEPKTWTVRHLAQPSRRKSGVHMHAVLLDFHFRTSATATRPGPAGRAPRSFPPVRCHRPPNQASARRHSIAPPSNCTTPHLHPVFQRFHIPHSTLRPASDAKPLGSAQSNQISRLISSDIRAATHSLRNPYSHTLATPTVPVWAPRITNLGFRLKSVMHVLMLLFSIEAVSAPTQPQPGHPNVCPQLPSHLVASHCLTTSSSLALPPLLRYHYHHSTNLLTS